MRKVVPVIAILVVICLVGFLSARRYKQEEVEVGVYSGTIEADESRIGSTVGGRVVDTPVREGDTVAKGQLIVRLQDDQLLSGLDAAIAGEEQAASKLKDLQLGPRQQEIDQASAAVRQYGSQLVKLRNGSRPEEIAASRAALDQAKEQLELLKNGARKEDIAQAEANLQAAVADHQYAQSNLTRVEKLVKDGAVAVRDLDQARDSASVSAERENAARQALSEMQAGTRTEEIRAAEQAVRQAQAKYALVKKGARIEDITSAEAAVSQSKAALANLQAGTRQYQIAQAAAALKQTQAQVAQIRANVRERSVLAPVNGQLLVLNVRAGDIVAPGQAVATVVDPNRLFVRIYVSAQDLGDLRVGSRLTVVSDSGVRAVGRVEQIPAEAEFTPRNVQTPEERALQQYAVKIGIPNTSMRMRAGMSATVRLRPL